MILDLKFFERDVAKAHQSSVGSVCTSWMVANTDNVPAVLK